MCIYLGLPAELPKFQHKRQLGETSGKTLQGADNDEDDTDWRIRSSTTAEAVMATSRSINDSSILDIEMDMA